MIRKYETEWDEGEVPNYWSVNHCQLLAERDLWATRLKMAKHALKLIIEFREITESRNYGLYCLEREVVWEKAIAAIEKKYNKVVEAVKKHEEE